MSLACHTLPATLSKGGQIIHLQAAAGPQRDTFTRQWLETVARPPGDTFLLDCDAQTGGPWAGVKELLRQILPDLLSAAPELVARHAAELVLVLPTLKAGDLDVPLTLTDTSLAEEKVRNYPMDRAYRNAHGLIDLLTSWQERSGSPSLLLVCDHFDHAGALGGFFFRELIRRRRQELSLSVVIVTEPGFELPDIDPTLDITLCRPNLGASPLPAPSPAEMTRRALQLEAEVGEDELIITENLAELISLWNRSETPEKALRWQSSAFSTFNHLGFYEDALPYGEIVLKNIDAICGQTIFTRWNLVGALCNCHLALNRPERALEIVETEALGAIEDPTDRVRIFYVLALIYSRFLPKKDFEQAERYINAGLAILETEAVPLRDRIFLKVFTLNGLAFIRFRQGRQQEALDLCTSGFETLGEKFSGTFHRLHRSVLLYNTGQVYANLKAHEEAIRYFTEAISMDPNYSEYYNERGNMYLDLGRLPEAIEDYHEAIRRSPPYFEVWTNLGQALKLLGNFDEAIEAYDRAIDIDPHKALPRVGKAQACEHSGKAALAIEEYSATLALGEPQPLVLANRASLLYETGDLEQALSDLDSAVELDPTQPSFYYNRAVALTDAQRTEDATNDFRTYLRLAPEAEDREDVEGKIEALAGQPPFSMAAAALPG